ncbi:hypothetical protein C943_01840 [Mariniradius saccharolyticus AK6]|uniref:Uncharacterized protein n=1 Tax=Mariniradius saccharolyticus AK6 TaxID=1239962 RepID=M7Y3S2_9BACT|nr:hypothetical protein C943_01840 [Mariniradius saccharolyticus AK6]
MPVFLVKDFTNLEKSFLTHWVMGGLKKIPGQADPEFELIISNYFA